MLRGDDANLAQQGENDGQLEGETKGQNQHHDEIEIGFDVGHERDARLAITACACGQSIEKLDGDRQQEEINQTSAEHEEYRCGHQIGEQHLPFMFVQTRCHEAVDLRGDQRKGDEHATKHGNLQLDQKYAEQLDRDQADVGAGAPAEGLDQKCENI